MKHISLLLAVSLTLASCDKPAAPHAPLPPTTPTPAGVVANQFSQRLQAANGIDGSQARDEALSKLARDAAEAKNLEVTKQALEGINSAALRDEAAAACAL